jgi:hypothetical protein
MKMLKCQIEDLPDHIASIKRYTHFYKIDLIETGIQDRMVAYTNNMYNNPSDTKVPFKVIDITGNAIAYISFYHGKTTPVTLVRGAFLSDYGNKHYVATDVLLNLDIVCSFLSYIIEERGSKEILVYQRTARARFTSEFIKKLIAPKLLLDGWTINVVVKIPPYGIVKDKVLTDYLVNQYNGKVSERMSIIQIIKTDTIV